MPTLETTFFFFLRTPRELTLHILIDADQPQNNYYLAFVKLEWIQYINTHALTLCECDAHST